MSQPRKVAVLVGSVRKDSVTRKVARAVAALAPSNLTFEEIPIGDLPYYNQDDEPNPPASYVEFRNRLEGVDAVLFATPEYNRGLPAVLKNAVDVGSRPYGQGALLGKPAAVVSVSPGALGGYGANHHLRQSLAVLNMPTLTHEAYVGNAYTLFGPDGELTSETTAEFLRAFGVAFADWIERHAPARETQAAA